MDPIKIDFTRVLAPVAAREIGLVDESLESPGGSGAYVRGVEGRHDGRHDQHRVDVVTEECRRRYG